jgi:uncharacterized protein YfaS (alpha-2-macroglobulin family)
MIRSRLGYLLAASTLSALLVLSAFGAKDAPPDRAAAAKQMKDGNWKDAYEGFSRLALDPADDPMQVGEDLAHAVNCLANLGRQNEMDAFREKVIAAHRANWRLLQAAAQTYLNFDHDGFIIAGVFERGGHRGGGTYANAYERDRVRALQLMRDAMKAAEKDPNKAAVGAFYVNLAQMLMGQRNYYEAWRLQYLTDLAALPDYDEGHYGGYGSSGPRGAPVDADGNPVYYHVPKSWETAASDGERWRWALVQIAEYDPYLSKFWATGEFAGFLWNQFGVQTMADYGWFFGRAAEADETKKDESGTWALHTLGEDETIARLATGIKRFKLPDEFNYIRIFKEMNNNEMLAQIFENRRQYPKAAEYWKLVAGQPGRVDQIVGNWGQFESVMTQPAGQGATVEFRFRNGRKVHFTAREVDVRKLLDDVKAYIKSSPKQLEWEKMQIQDIGQRLLQENQNQYVGAQVAAWDLDLEPRPAHFDKRITVATPLQKAGAYFVTAQMDGGNTSHIVLWVADTAIVKKALDKGTYYFVADAASGRPVAKANLEFFGYMQKSVNGPNNRTVRYEILTRDFAEFTDADGQLVLNSARQESGYQWLILATTPEGRLAYLGFTGVWYGDYRDQEYNEAKYFLITDRPVYRPKQKVQFKVWANQAQYDREGKSPYAGQKFAVQINNPKGEKVFENAYTADEYGGFNGEFEIPDQATLGVYGVSLPSRAGIGSFRVEEYKKPEFEVKVEAPAEPVALGEKIEARVQAKYYFGAPVTEAKVKYKVLRSEHAATWYPIGLWDWFYEPGYWWFAYDYTWWPGWRDWGCRRPIMWWWPRWQREQPEIVAEGEAALDKDGSFKLPIDTAPAKLIHGDQDHRYDITVEVTDASRRTIVGQGRVLVARRPFKVYAWVDRGHYRAGDVVRASFSAQTLDSKPVQGEGTLRLFKVTYGKDAKPVESEVQKWDLATNEEGRAQIQLKASEAGQYRLSYTVTDSKKHAIEGGYVFCIRGEGFDGGQFRFNDIELVTDQREYKPGDKVNLMVNTNRAESTVLLFVRPSNGVCLPPKVLRLKGKSVLEAIEVEKKDMPNFFVEALTVSGGKVFSEMREIVVPPESRVLQVDVKPSAEKYKPGEKAKIKVRLTDPTGEPYSGSTVLALYDKSVEYISGGSNVPEIKAFFWKWRRHHQPASETSLTKGGRNMVPPGNRGMDVLGIFGYLVPEEVEEGAEGEWNRPGMDYNEIGGRGGFAAARPMGTPGAARSMGKMQAADGMAEVAMEKSADAVGGKGGEGPSPPLLEPTVRTKFADTALWVAALQTNEKGEAEVELAMPENLTTWKARVWAMGGGARCGEGTAEVVTAKNLLVRLQAPRFFVQKDEVVLSANVHNYLKIKKAVNVGLELEGGTLGEITPLSFADSVLDKDRAKSEGAIEIEAGGEARVDWRVKVVQPGEAVVRMKALTDEESDAMEMKFPVYVHGMLKTESFCGVIRPDKTAATIDLSVPAERRPDETRLEVRYSPTLAAAMVDALPYMAEYPYGCTEQTLNRFLPTVITQKALMRMGLDLKDIEKKRTNLNAQEIGDPAERAKQWQRFGRNPVFDEKLLADMVKAGVERLGSMQCSDGGWGWFSGWGERSWPHTTAVVVHGLQVARENDVAIVPGVLERGIAWLKRYQAEEVVKLKNGMKKDPPHPWKTHADNLDAFVYLVLADEKSDDKDMREFLYRDRNDLSVYAKAMFGLALHKLGHTEERDMLIRNVEQYLVQDEENQTAYLKLPEGTWWWCWYGSEIEADATYLKLLVATDPKGQTASRLVKYLLNNRKHATYWNSTRDTALCLEAFADYIKASGEDAPDMTVQILLDGKAVREVKIDKTNLFTFDGTVVLEGKAVTDGKHTVEFRKVGKGPLYFNAYLTNFTLEDPITRAGLEIKVDRKYYRLVPVDKTIKAAGARGQAVDQKVEKFEREPLKDLALLKSGNLVEIELEIESKNDYEYIMFEDMKAAGFEPVDLQSGYGGRGLGAYMELRDERVCFFVRWLARGKHSVSYRMRAEIPGRFSALPTRASAMYAPELRANSDEIKLRIED